MVIDMQKRLFAARLDEALRFAGVPDDHHRRSWMRKKWGISLEAARKWLEGLAMPRTHRIPSIAADLGVQGEWLLTGNGEMIAATHMIQEDRKHYTLDPREALMVDSFRAADERTKEIMAAVANTGSKQAKK